MSESRSAQRPLVELRVLIVDDDDDGRELLSTLLEERGAAVTSASNAADAFALLRSERPDILVSDIAMPGEDGFTLVGRVRGLSDLDGGSTPAIAVTAFATAADRRRALAAGFDGWLPKPIDHEALVALITQVRGERKSGVG